MIIVFSGLWFLRRLLNKNVSDFVLNTVLIICTIQLLLLRITFGQSSPNV